MVVSISSIEAAAPDQASLKAATKLLKPAIWPERQCTEDKSLIWGACQGSGANPYRVVVDLSDLGAKCTCPSRKFPCKHALALMLQWVDAPGGFGQAAVPEWVTDWLGRRRKTTTADKPASVEGKSLQAAIEAAPEEADDPKAIAKREAAKAKRNDATRQAVSDGLAELESWISDQLKTGLSDMLGDLTARCRRIASRLVDAKAAALAGRVDSIPAQIMALPQRDRGDALISALGKLVVLSRAWGGGDCDAAIRREIIGAETREALMDDANALHHSGPWEVIATREEARRDGLIAQSTWLLGLDQGGPRFALLQDFYPASVGKKGSSFSAGEQFWAEMVFYPSAAPLRAQIAERRPVDTATPWPTAPQDALIGYVQALSMMPWLAEMPLLLPPGQLALAQDDLWWTGPDAPALPIRGGQIGRTIRGAKLHGAVVLWDAHSADLLAADTNLGRYHAAG